MVDLQIYKNHTYSNVRGKCETRAIFMSLLVTTTKFLVQVMLWEKKKNNFLISILTILLKLLIGMGLINMIFIQSIMNKNWSCLS